MDARSEATEPSLLRQEIDVYLGCFGSRVGIGEFAEINSRGQKDPHMRGRFYEFLRLDARRPRPSMWNEVTARLQRIYNDAIARIGDGPHAGQQVRDLHEKLRKSLVPFLTWTDDAVHGRRLIVGQRQVMALYESAHDRKAAGKSQAIAARDGNASVDIVIKQTKLDPRTVIRIMQHLLEHLSHDEAQQVLFTLGQGLGIYQFIEGCTTIRVELPPSAARSLVAAFGDERLDATVIMLRPSNTTGRTLFDPRRPDPPENAAEAEERFARLWRQVRLRQAAVTPWRRLRWLLSPAVADSPMAHVIAMSGDRAYATAGLWVTDGMALGADMVMAWLLWPLLTAALLAITLVPLRVVLPDISVVSGTLSGLVLALSGGQICGFVVGPTAAGAGGIFMGWAFGFAQAVAIGQMGSSGRLRNPDIDGDFFIAVTGGPLGLSAPHWPGHLPPALIAVMMACVAVGIAASGWLMAQPASAGIFRAPRWPGMLQAISQRLGLRRIELVGSLLGAMAGAGIGITFGIYSALQELGVASVTAFAMAFALVGGAGFGASIGLGRARDTSSALRYAMMFAVTVVALCYAVEGTDGTAALIALSALTAVFQATWFTAAFVVGLQFSRRAAVLATTLEGAVGFTIFIIVRMVTSAPIP